VTLKELIAVVDECYAGGEGLVMEYHEKGACHHGDTLAEFIAAEIADTFEPAASEEAQRAEARRVLLAAADELTSAARLL
jgi:hypothetical protein